ncbi:ABC transporter permease [Saccharopolyspora shandongensis]|uniref:ABC transporter permease n=1 Tax=Saccharopolyspora shandongensis TaxID=418495 RepID=UPI0033D48766
MGRPARDSKWLGPVASIAILVAGAMSWWLGSSLGWWSEAVLPKPGDVWEALLQALGTEAFWMDARRTAVEVVLSFAGGSLLGLLLGVIFWKWQPIGRIFEPYLVSFYAVPLVLFYPIMIVLVGINLWSVVILATIMALIPMALNSWIGLSALKPVYLKLGRTLQVSRRQLLFEIALPGASPYILAGLRMAAVYALIGSVAMEFTTASAGLGFRIRYLYESFESAGMYAYVIVVLAASLLLTLVLAVFDRMLMGWRNES